MLPSMIRRLNGAAASGSARQPAFGEGRTGMPDQSLEGTEKPPAPAGTWRCVRPVLRLRGVGYVRIQAPAPPSILRFVFYYPSESPVEQDLLQTEICD